MDKPVSELGDRELLEEAVTLLREFKNAVENFDISSVLGSLGGGKNDPMAAIMGALIK